VTWLVTGGAGYIGAHVVAALGRAGHRVVVLDDLSTGLPDRLPEGVALVRGAVGDRVALDEALRSAPAGAPVQGVVHLAARTSAPESLTAPLAYWRANVGDVVVLLEGMAAAGVGRLVASSSAAVYGRTALRGTLPLTEDDETRPQNPYGTTKRAGELLVQEAAGAGGLSAILLRYFNVVGTASPELADPKAAGLLPRVLDARSGGAPLVVNGGRHPTADGSPVRDFVHVLDIADAHVAAVGRLLGPPLCEVLNVGTGQGNSVLDVVARTERVTAGPVPHSVGPARPGDPSWAVADASRVAAVLGWRSRYDLDEAISSAWRALTAAGSPVRPGGPAAAG
jgi:UDP-glucose 4-epimerase